MKLYRTITGIQIMSGYSIPWYLGRCYWDVNTDVVILAPIPFNFFVGWARDVWWFLKRGPKGFSEREEKARVAGFRSGLEAGRAQATSLLKNYLKTGNNDYLHDFLSLGDKREP